MLDALEHAGNPGRGAHEPTLHAARIVYHARETLATLLHAESPDCIAFTANVTQALNTALCGLVRPGDHVITTVCEHNSVLRPLYRLREQGAEVSFVEVDDTGRLRYEQFEKFLRPKMCIRDRIAAEVLECDLDNITVFGADTDSSPYDSGSYASSTTYITGKAVEKCALKLRSQICKLGAQLLDCSENDVEFDGKTVFASANPSKSVSLGDIATASMFGHDIPLEVTETHMSPLSPPPYMVGAAEVEMCIRDRPHDGGTFGT